MELQLGLALPLHNHAHAIKHKPGFAFQDHDPPTPRSTNTNHPPHTLPLLSWNDDPNDNNPPNNPKDANSCTFHREDGEKNQVVGWPPVETWRTKAFHQRPPLPMVENRRPVAADNDSNNQNGGPNCLFVKVKMEGVAIARKLDLRLYHSHNSLKNAIITMFAPYHKKGWDFTVIYEDKDGDWLLAQDLPWNSFVESVQRLKILVRKRNEEE